ncbi:AraC family transcriptional regulator [Paracoccus aerodenitrificans]|uniref:AraC family transcriptional regulator n=1 Tax=Paracoccus aerodenitrificans TaxID=3017781 RepID=UPI0022F02478|nr:AraC family transcriptional regulator [Paracoccus aerodenitrificans]WBU64317.1 AraC family transcriptional regulator [Paracoccus aerodenitrificans]
MNRIRNPELPLIGRSVDAQSGEDRDHWRSVFSGLWGALEVKPVVEGNISGSLYSRTIGDLSFNRIEFGNQQFEKSHNRRLQEEPFFSLSFPESGTALCEIDGNRVQLLPQNTYLLNNGLSAKLRVKRDYSTFNVKIPVTALEHRLGCNAGILSRTIVQPDAIFHMMQRLIIELLQNVDEADVRTVGFMTNQMLDTVAFFLSSGGAMSDDSIAVQALRARVLAFIDANYRNPDLTPAKIASTCGISRSYLYKIFADGPSVMERVRKRRLEAARGMLTDRDRKMTMTQVALNTGFSSSSEFSRLFKKAFGAVPSRV